MQIYKKERIWKQQIWGRDNKDNKDDKDTTVGDSGDALAADIDKTMMMVVITTIMRNKLNQYKYRYK